MCATRSTVKTLKQENTELRESWSNYDDAFRIFEVKMKDSLAQLESTVMGQQTAAPSTSGTGGNSDLADRISRMEREFPTDIVESNDKIEVLVSELKSRLDNFEVRSSGEPLTRWQEWEKEACEIVGALNPNAKCL